MSEPRNNGEGVALRLEGIKRSFQQGEARLDVLRGVDLTIKSGEVIALIGPSGAGKSTLLQITGLLEHPDAGEIYLGGKPCAGLSDSERTRLRREHLGFIYQSHHLLPEFSALENVVLPQMVAGVKKRDAEKRGIALLETVGLGKRVSHRPAELSGGEQQRVAIARSLANEPRLLLADEPTGNLDQNTAEKVFTMLMEVLHQAGRAALIATHNPELARRMDRMVTLEEGKLVEVR